VQVALHPGNLRLWSKWWWHLMGYWAVDDKPGDAINVRTGRQWLAVARRIDAMDSHRMAVFRTSGSVAARVFGGMTLRYNIHDFLNVEVDDALPDRVLKNMYVLERFGTTAFRDDELPLLTIGGMPAGGAQVPDDCRHVDNCYTLNDDFLLEKAQYKWSKWTLALCGLSEMQKVSLLVGGGHLSQWVWPFRTVSAAVRLMLGYRGDLILHAAGFATGDRATLVLAPSSTGKTLTSLHWLCDGRAFYGDDLVIYANGKLYGLADKMSFWSDRYTSADMLPAAMPQLHGQDRRLLLIFGLLRRATFGQVEFGVHLNVKAYWPQSVAAPLPLRRVVLMYRADRFRIDTDVDVESVYNRVVADLRFQALPIMRWSMCARLACPEMWLVDWEQRTAATVRDMLEGVELVRIGVPPDYGRNVYRQIAEHLE